MNKCSLVITLSLILMGFFCFGKRFAYAQVSETDDLDSRVEILEGQIKNENQIISTLQKKEGSIAIKKQRLLNTIEQEKQKIAQIEKDRQDKELLKQQEQQRQQELKRQGQLAQEEKNRQKEEIIRQQWLRQLALEQKEEKRLGAKQQEQKQRIQEVAKEPGEDIASWLARKKQLAQQQTIPYKQTKEPKEEISMPKIKTQALSQETRGGKRESSIKAWLDKLDTKFRKVVW